MGMKTVRVSMKYNETDTFFVTVVVTIELLQAAVVLRAGLRVKPLDAVARIVEL